MYNHLHQLIDTLPLDLFYIYFIYLLFIYFIYPPEVEHFIKSTTR